jgi:oligosaccharide 4-alpha-D-glucosyltransferase
MQMPVVSPAAKEIKSLYVRWLQFAQYTPVFRPHGTALYETDPNAYSFPSEIALMDEPYRALATKVANNRYSMLPL